MSYMRNSSLGSGISRTTWAANYDDKDLEAITQSCSVLNMPLLSTLGWICIYGVGYGLGSGGQC